MVDVLSLARVVTISVSHPYSVDSYKIMVSNLSMVKDSNCSDSDVLTYVSVKYYSLRVSAIRPYAHTLVRLYEIPFQHKLVYSSILTP